MRGKFSYYSFMTPDQASQTAEYMAFFRAMESVHSPRNRLFTDPFARHFLRPSLRTAVAFSRVPLLGWLVGWYADRRLPGARTSAIARTRLIDDVVRQALEADVPQIVVLGAGFDCRSYRIVETGLAAVFEVDHPLTLASKLAKLREIIPIIPKNIRFVEIDFDRQNLRERLAENGFDAALRALFVWEGVTNYLTAEAVDAVLRFVGGCAAGSRVVFTYVHSGALDGSVEFDGAAKLLRDVSQIGEPWTFGLLPEQVPDYLRRKGLQLDRDAGAREYRAQYFGLAARQMRGYDFYHVVIAHVPRG
jgi:methyltransferase (TIGR00027 family)